MTIEQLIEYHRVRARLASKGAMLALLSFDIATAEKFNALCATHMAAVRLLESLA